MSNKGSAKAPFQAVEINPTHVTPKVVRNPAAAAHPDDWVKDGDEGVPDDPFVQANQNPFLPPLCKTCRQAKTLNRFGYCAECTAKSQQKPKASPGPLPARRVPPRA